MLATENTLLKVHYKYVRLLPKGSCNNFLLKDFEHVFVL